MGSLYQGLNPKKVPLSSYIFMNNKYVKVNELIEDKIVIKFFMLNGSLIRPTYKIRI